MFSERSRFDETENPIAIALRTLRTQGASLIDLTLSNPTKADVPYEGELILDAFRDEAWLRYEPDSLGLKSARECVAQMEGVDSDQVVLTASTSEAYSFLFKLLCEAGDEVLVPEPSYPLFEHLARYEQVKLVPYDLVYDGSWSLDTDSVKKAIGPKTKAVIVVQPNNPTGSYLSHEELEFLISTGKPLISDEVFFSYSLSDREHARALDAGGGLTFTLGGLSKFAAMPQLKLGWLICAGPQSLSRVAMKRLDLLADTFLSVNTPVQVALPKLLQASEPTRRAIQERTRANLDFLTRALMNSPLTLLRVDGGWYANLRLPNTRNEDEWVLQFLSRGVWVQPGYFYDFKQQPYVVVSLLTPEEAFIEGIRRLIDEVQR